MRLRTFSLWMVRESRGSLGRVIFFAACLAVGVAAVVAVAGLSAGLDEGIRGEARNLLAADVAIRSNNRGLPEDFDLKKLLPRGARIAELREMTSVVAAPPQGDRPGRSQLAEVKVVLGGYPFYGELVLSPKGQGLDRLLTAETTVVAPELLNALALSIGSELRIGGQPFRIVGTVSSEPDRATVGAAFGPRVFLSKAGLARAALIGRGSRVGYKTLIALPAGAPPTRADALAEAVKAALPQSGLYRVETYRQAQPELRENLKRVARYLGLVALLSLLIGGIGVAQSVRAWLAGRLDAIAILKCLGFRPREVLALYLGQTFVLGLVGSLVGLALGVAVQLALPEVLSGLVPAALIRPWQPAALLRGLGLGTGVALLFSLPPLASILRVPPARVLRRDADPLPVHRATAGLAALFLLGGLFAIASAQAESFVQGAQFTAALGISTLALALGAFGLARAIARLPRLASVTLRHGLGALARPGAATVGAIVALGLGVLVVLTMALVERRLSGELSRELPADAPSAFLVDVQPDQWAGVSDVLARSGAREIESVPVVMARIAAIDGRTIEQLSKDRAANQPQDRGRRWALTREQRLTYGTKLPKGNVIVAGSLWNDPNLPEVSIEEEFADELGVKVGSRLVFDIQGVSQELAVTSIRTVDWSTFGINFYLLVEPGVLEAAPQQRLASARLAEGSEQGIQDRLAAGFPNVTLLRLREVMGRILGVLRRIGLGVRLLGAFTVASGIAILAGAIAATSVRRGREVALLKTLGLTRGGVAAAFATEYALIGLVAGLIGAGGAGLLAWGVLTRGFELKWTFEAIPFAIAIAGSVFVSVAAGLAASWRALARRPIEVLRAD